MTVAQRLRAWLLHRQADQLIKRAIAGRHTQSAWQTGRQQQDERLPEIHRSAWFALVALTVAFGAGYVVADDARIERDQQQQLTTLCAQKWPDAPGAATARLRACPIKKQS